MSDPRPPADRPSADRPPPERLALGEASRLLGVDLPAELEQLKIGRGADREADRHAFLCPPQ